MTSKPMFGVPQGSVRVENPDGVYLGGPDNHSLYDRTVVLPIVPGDFDVNHDAPVRVPITRE